MGVNASRRCRVNLPLAVMPAAANAASRLMLRAD